MLVVNNKTELLKAFSSSKNSFDREIGRRYFL